jgi:hypothetical protein
MTAVTFLWDLEACGVVVSITLLPTCQDEHILLEGGVRDVMHHIQVPFINMQILHTTNHVPCYVYAVEQ